MFQSSLSSLSWTWRIEGTRRLHFQTSPCLTRSLQLETRQNFLGVRDGTDFNLRRIVVDICIGSASISISVVLDKVFAVGDGPFLVQLSPCIHICFTSDPFPDGRLFISQLVSLRLVIPHCEQLP